MAKAKTSMGLEENVAGALCYLGLWLTGIIFYFMEKDNKTVRFHAMQSIVTFIPLSIIGWIFQSGILWGGYGYYYYGYGGGGILSLLGWAVWVITGLLWLILMFKAYSGEKFKLPVVGDIAEKHA